MTQIVHLSEKQFLALKALATYRYLTAKQFVKLNIANTDAQARDQILVKLLAGCKPLAKVHNPGRYIGYGQLPYIYCLTKHGAQALADYRRVSIDEIIYPKGGVQFQRDIFHRIKVIDCHIKFRQWAEAQGIHLTIADMYFDKVGSQKRGGQVSRSRVDLDDGSYIESDAIFGFKHKGQDFLYVLEYHRTQDSKQISRQLERYKQLRTINAISEKYKILTHQIILSIKEKN